MASAVVVAALGLAGTGCASQVAGLAPVGGDAMTSVRIASIDLLLQQQLSVLTAPVCTQVAKSVSCIGGLMDGQVVSVQADVTKSPYTMTLKVGDAVVYEGAVMQVLDDAAQATQ